jgi:predicted transcriptional regulator
MMYRSYLSYTKFKEYLRVCLESGLLAFNMERDVFTITSKGLQFMSAFDEIKQIFPSQEEETEARRVVSLKGLRFFK